MSAAPRVLLHTDRPADAQAVLAASHPDLEVHLCDTYDGVAAALAAGRADVIYSVRFAGTASFPRAAMLENPTVKWIAVGGSGVDHLGLWNPEAVVVTNSAGVAADMMAEYALGAMLSFSLNFKAFARAQAERRWTSGEVAPISGTVVAIVGLGKTGVAFARRAEAMGMTVLGVRARPKATRHVHEVGGVDALPGFLARADYVLVCAPLTESTRGLLGAHAFSAMKPTAVLVDISRGGVVDEGALLASLREGRLGGAALDVFATEPLPTEHPFWGFDNVIVTPHCSSVYRGWEAASVRLFADNLSRYRRGEPLLNVVDPTRGY